MKNTLMPEYKIRTSFDFYAHKKWLYILELLQGCGECVKGLGQVSLDSGKPVTFGVLTVDSIEQAIERSGTKAGNKGAEAAITAVEMVSLLRQLDA